MNQPQTRDEAVRVAKLLLKHYGETQVCVNSLPTTDAEVERIGVDRVARTLRDDTLYHNGRL